MASADLEKLGPNLDDLFQPPPERINIPAENDLELQEIRPYDPEPSQGLYEIIVNNAADPEIDKVARNIHSPDDIKRWIAESMKRGFMHWVVRQDDGTIVGFAARIHARGDRSKVEISYAIDKDHAGKGNATAVVKALTKYIFENDPPVLGIVARTKADSTDPNGVPIEGNRASAAVLVKAGFKLIDTERNDKMGEDEAVYRLTKPWPEEPDEAEASLDQGV